MKKFIIIVLLLIIPSIAFAGKKATSKNLTTSGVLISSYAISNGSTVTSDSIYQPGNVGFSSLVMNVSGNIAISYQVSKDNSNWFDPYTTDGASLTNVGAIVSSITADRWIILTAKLAPYIRYKFISTGSSTISANVIWQDEN